MFVKPKKGLGQHFLKDQNIAKRIVDLLDATNADSIIEVGPGTGILTKLLKERFGKRLYLVEIDGKSVEYLRSEWPDLEPNLIQGDFLRLDLATLIPGQWAIIGNFPYNISSQILFKSIAYRDRVVEIVGMFQREVARRVTSGPGSKEYGILSVLLEAYFTRKFEFTVSEQVFSPPPKVKSGVLRLERKQGRLITFDEELFFSIVKAAFNQRRKMLRNSLSAFITDDNFEAGWLTNRPEQLDLIAFIQIVKEISSMKQ